MSSSLSATLWCSLRLTLQSGLSFTHTPSQVQSNLMSNTVCAHWDPWAGVVAKVTREFLLPHWRRGSMINLAFR